MIDNKPLSDSKIVRNSCTLYTVLFVNAFLIIISISSASIYFQKNILKEQFIKHINGKY